MADVNHNLPALDPPASIAHTRRFAAALDRRVTWADQLATRRPLGSGGASAELVHRFTGMGASAIGPWAARLAERYGAGERAGAPAGADLPLAMALRRSVLAPTSRAWAPQLAPDRFDARHDDTAPEAAGRVAGELSAQGWPGQPAPSHPPIVRAGEPAPARAVAPWPTAGARPADRLHPSAIADLMERTTVAPAPDRARAAAESAPAIAQAAAVSRAIPAQSAAPAEPSATAQPVVAQPWNAAEHAAEADPGIPMPASLASAATAPAAAARDDQHPAHAPILVSAATAPAAAARDDQHPAHAPILVDAQPAPLPVPASVRPAGEPQLALPLVTQRRTALLRQPGPGPLARMGYAVPGEPARPPAVLPTNSSPVPARAAIPGQAPLPPQSAVPVAPIPISRRATPGPTAPALAAAHDAPSLRALPAAAPSLPSVALALPGAFNTTIARRYDSPPGVQAAPVLVQRSWSPGHAAAGQAEPLAIYAGAAAWAGRAAVDPQPSVRQIARMLAPAEPIRPAIIAAPPAPPIDPAATPAPLNTLEPWLETAGPDLARAVASAAPADWGALPLVQHTLARSVMAGGIAAGQAYWPGAIVGRQAAFAQAAAVESAPLGRVRAHDRFDSASSPDRTFQAAGPAVPVVQTAVPGWADQPAPALPLLNRSASAAGDQREPGWRDERPALTLYTVARAAAPAGAPQSVPLPRDASGFAMAAALQRAAAPLDAPVAAPPAPNSAAPAPAAGGSPPIDELARKVYDYLRRELRIEQERAGWRPW